MRGEVIKTIHNLTITLDEDAGLYRVYNPDGVELYNSDTLEDVEDRCEDCFDYVMEKKHLYYAIQVDFEGEIKRPSYSIYFATPDSIKHEADVIGYAVEKALFKTMGDEGYIVAINELSLTEYKAATEK